MRHSLRRDSRGATAVEFAIVGMMLCLMTFAIIETGLLWWLRTGMQLTAAETARCGAIGFTHNTGNNTANFYCTSTATTQNYAENYATGNGNAIGSGAVPWLLPNMVMAANVTVNGRVTNSAFCNSAPGNFFAVSITSGFFQFLPPPLGNFTSLSVKSCYPMP